MRFTFSPLLAVWLVGLALAPGSHAQQGGNELEGSVPEELLSLPTCGLRCLASSMTVTSCEPTDQACLCKDNKYQDEVTECVMQACTIRQALAMKNTTETNCGHPIRDRSTTLVNTIIILGVITGAIVLSRLVFKFFYAHLPLAADDWLILATTLFGVISEVLIIHGTVVNGLGRDVWTMTPDQITRFGMYFYLQEWLYFLEVTVLKMSILWFYLRIFPTKMTRRVIWGSIVFNGLFGVAFVLAAIFQCQPIRHFWVKWDEEQEGTCVNVNAIAWANAIGSIVLDIWMLAIPLSQLPHLQLHWKRKVGVGLMFCVGIFVTIVSILRLQSLVNFAKSHNQTWDNWPVSIWSVVEINVGIMCACMPTIRLMLAKVSHIFRESTNRGTSYLHSDFGGTSGRAGRSGGRSGMGRGAHQSQVVASRGLSPPPANGGGVMYKKSFTVQYSDHDESSLVQMRDFADLGTRESGRPESGSSYDTELQKAPKTDTSS